MRLTKDAIERAAPPEAGRKSGSSAMTWYADWACASPRAAQNRSSSRRASKGRPRRLTLGGWPDLTVILARQRALEIRAAIARGEDPAAEAEAARKEATFGDLGEIYMERHARPNKRSAWQDENTLRRYVPNGWNSRRLSDITRADVARLHAKIGEDHGHYAANRTLALLRTMFNLARVWELFKGENPAQGIKPFREQRRERYLNPEELAAVNRALLEEPDWRWRAYFPLALMLGTRKSELLAMRWADIDMERRTWRIPQTKAGNSHLLPLPGPVMATLSGLPSRGKSDWVFPATAPPGISSNPRRRGSESGRAPAWPTYGFTTYAIPWRAGWSRKGSICHLSAGRLNHTQTATTARYAHLALDPVRAALEQTAALMTGDGSGERKSVCRRGARWRSNGKLTGASFRRPDRSTGRTLSILHGCARNFS